MKPLLESSSISRRRFLKGAGALISLPLLESLMPIRQLKAAELTGAPKRILTMCAGLGLHGPNLFPKTPGANYEFTPYLKELERHRNEFTLFSGIYHPDVDGGHSATASFLTGAPHPGGNGFRNSISLDQVIAQEIGHETRHGFLSLNSGGPTGYSWTRSGVQIPPIKNPTDLYRKLFMQGTPEEIEAEMQRLDEGGSILDTVIEHTRGLNRQVSKNDAEKLDQYFTAVRETENRLVKSREWAQKPKTEVDYELPTGADAEELRGECFEDLIALAFQTDSTRVIASTSIFDIHELELSPGKHHDYSHHGRDEQKIEKLTEIEQLSMKKFARFLDKLKERRDLDGSRLIDNTMVLLGSNLGNASSHNNTNLPVILAGGGFRHGSYVAFDEKNNYPLCNLFVSMMQNMGLEFDKFSSSTGTMQGLERA